MLLGHATGIELASWWLFITACAAGWAWSASPSQRRKRMRRDALGRIEFRRELNRDEKRQTVD
jgi:hypothetical protein